MRTGGLKGALSPRLVAISIAVLLLAMTLALTGSSSGTHDASVSMVPVNSKAGENIEYTLTVTNASGDNINNVTLEVPLDEGGNARYRVATPVPAPENWKSELPENDGFGYAKKITWRTENAQAHIAAGESEDFTFTATTPLYDRVDNWACRTSDISDYVDNDLVTTRVDNMPSGPPTLVWPDNDENINDNTPNLDWNPVIDPSVPVTYDLLVDDDPDFLSSEVDVTGIAVDNYLTAELGENRWHWKVRAVDNASNISLWSSPRSFRVDITPPDPPTHVWPADGENIEDNIPNLDWDPVIDLSMPVTYDLKFEWWNENWLKRRPITISATHPENYQLYIVVPYDNDMRLDYGDLRFIENGASGELSYWIENYTTDNAKVWVRRFDNSDTTIYVYYGNPSAGSAENGDATFELFDDFNDSSLDGNKWTVVRGTVNETNQLIEMNDRGYLASVADMSDNVRVFVKYMVDNALQNINICLRSDATPTGTYYGVRNAVSSYDFGLESSPYYTLISKNEGGSPTTLAGPSYRSLSLSTWYEGMFWIYGPNTDFDAKSIMAGTELSATNKTYSPSAESRKLCFYNREEADHGWVYLDDVKVTKYVSPDPVASVRAEEIAIQTRIPDDNYQITTELSEGIWRWKVRAVDNAGNIGVWSPLLSFRVDITPPPAPNLLAPDNGKKICDNTPTFGWTAITIENSLPATYDLQVDNDDNLLSPEVNVTGLTENTYTPPSELQNGNYSWHVRARDNAGNWSENWSDIWTILINSTPHDATVTLAPINSKPGVSIDYVLTVTDNATGDNIDNVTLEIPLDENGNALYRVVPPIPAPAGWTSEAVLIDGFGYARKVRWLADNLSAHIAAGESEDFTFTATTPLYDNVYAWTCLTRDIIGYVDNDNFATRVDNVPPNAPTLLEPVNGVWTTDNTPTFGWTTVNDDSLPVTYTIQVDNDNDFSSPEIDVSGLTDNAYTPTSPLAGDNYSWRARATDNVGNVGPFSSTWTLLIMKGLPPHDPIYIDGNAGFTPENGVNGGGSGTENDPYVIENWDISAENDNGIEIRNTTAHFVVRNCVVEIGWGTRPNYYYGIYLYNVVNGRIENNTCENNYYGIRLSSSDNNTLENNTSSNNRNSIQLDYSDNNTISNNTSSNNSDGILLESSSNNTLDNNTVENNTYDGIALWDSDNNLVTNNTSSNNGDGIWLEESDNNTLDNNTVGNNTYGGIWLEDSDNNTISNNTCENNHSDGIVLSSSNNNLLSNNIVENNNGYGIDLYESDNIKMRNNALSNNRYNFSVYGTTLSHFVHDIDISNLVNGKPIRYLVGHSDEVIGPSIETGYLGLVNCDNIRVENLALGHNGQGILLASTQNSRVENSIFENNSFYVISLYDSDNNTISNNTCENNIYGIYLRENSDNNQIYHNNLINNGNQAYDDGTNTWDNGYPSGGNYWSDYAGVDENHGENQDIPGSDGIGDTPYYIPGDNNLDRYPLMEPWPWITSITVLPSSTDIEVGETENFYAIATYSDGENEIVTHDADWTVNPAFGGSFIFAVILGYPYEIARFTLENKDFNVTVTASYMGYSDNALVFPWHASTVTFRLENLYAVHFATTFRLLHGSKIVVKFYTYGDGYENEKVIETFSPPWIVTENESIRHPDDIGVKKARVDLTYDNTENVISTIASFTVTKTILEIRFTEIPFEWALAGTPEEKTELETEFSEVPLYWALAPD